jgi:hypothetical protein
MRADAERMRMRSRGDLAIAERSAAGFGFLASYGGFRAATLFGRPETVIV